MMSSAERQKKYDDRQRNEGYRRFYLKLSVKHYDKLEQLRKTRGLLSRSETLRNLIEEA